ncbi:MAG: hypothetical protein L6R43_11185 [Planctomycetes bacterium]|nr:hypothetical protein [Planctomycetota bacterium]
MDPDHRPEEALVPIVAEFHLRPRDGGPVGPADHHSLEDEGRTQADHRLLSGTEDGGLPGGESLPLGPQETRQGEVPLGGPSGPAVGTGRSEGQGRVVFPSSGEERETGPGDGGVGGVEDEEGKGDGGGGVPGPGGRDRGTGIREGIGPADPAGVRG